MQKTINKTFQFQPFNTTPIPAFEPAPERTVLDKDRPFPFFEALNMKLKENSEKKSTYGKRSVVRTRNQTFCSICKLQVGLVAVEKAAETYETTSVEIVVLAEKGIIHRLHNAKGNVMLCANSLFDAEPHLEKTKSLSFENSLKITMA